MTWQIVAICALAVLAMLGLFGYLGDQRKQRSAEHTAAGERYAALVVALRREVGIMRQPVETLADGRPVLGATYWADRIEMLLDGGFPPGHPRRVPAPRTDGERIVWGEDL